jgi:hypothetical protein
MKPKIFDDFFDIHLINYISYSVQHPDYPWSYNSCITQTQGEEPWHFGMSRKFLDSEYPDIKKCPEDKLFFPIFFKIQEEFGLSFSDLLRARLDMTFRSPDNTLHKPHVDMGEKPHYSFIVYLNDSDGDTIIFNETSVSDKYSIQEVVSPKKNRLLAFGGHHYHTGHSPSKNNNRVILNVNYGIN